jgi:hypothetical protein
VIDELRAQWADAGPLLDDADRAQAAEFEHVTQKVLDAAGAQAQAPREREERPERPERGERRRRRERPSVETPVVAAAPAIAHDTPTAPAKIPFEPLPPPPVPPEVALPRTKSVSTMPPMDDLDTAWDLGDEDPTAGKSEPEPQQTPSSSEMAGDGATGGDGIDEPGWD